MAAHVRPPHLRQLTSRTCASPVRGPRRSPPDLVREMHERLGVQVVIGYASTEAAIISGSDPGDGTSAIVRSVGRARSNVEIQIVGPSGSLPTGEVGTVCCRSAAVMRGYWKDPAATAKVIDPEGWLWTGDLGSLDSQGYLYLVGRKDEMYLRGAYNVYPVEVERIISRAFRCRTSCRRRQSRSRVGPGRSGLRGSRRRRPTDCPGLAGVVHPVFGRL